MDDELPQHEGLEARIAAAIAPTLVAMGYELVRVQIQGKERPTVQVMADRADGKLIGVGDCSAISHAVGAVMDVDDPFSGLWTLEVSSPGIDRPLTRTKDWLRFAGHIATAEMSIPFEGRRRFRGIILGADSTTIRLKLDDGSEIALPRPDMRRAKLVLTDELIAASRAEAGIAPDQGGLDDGSDLAALDDDGPDNDGPDDDGPDENGPDTKTEAQPDTGNPYAKRN